MHRRVSTSRSEALLALLVVVGVLVAVALSGRWALDRSGLTPGSASPAARMPEPPGAVVLVGAGDIADCGSDADEATARLLDSIDGRVFTAGDNAYENGSLDEFTRCYEPTWGRHRARTLPAIGNHEWQTPEARGYHDYFGDRAGRPGQAWYATTLGDWRLIVLDSDCQAAGGCTTESPQGRWLADELATNPARCTVAVWHHPRFSSGTHGDDPSIAPLWRAMYEAGVEVVVNGHEHSYERFAPQDGDGRSDPQRGVRQIVVGTGGRHLRGFERAKPNSEVRDDRTHGLLRLVLRTDGYDWTFMPIVGRSFTDSGSGSCH